MGRDDSSGVRNSDASAIPPAVNAPAAGVRAPASKLTAERAKPPVTGYPPEKALATFAAPRPTSSWSGEIRWRRFAASVWATETLSTKPMIEISSAGTQSRSISERSADGTAKGGRPDGMAPTRSTPFAPRSSRLVARIVSTTAITGPPLATMSAARGGRPSAVSARPKPLRTQNRKISAGRPMAIVQGFAAPSDIASEPSMAGQLSPPASIPTICLTWLVAMRMPLAVMKPLMTGCERRLARNPSRSRPRTVSMTPDRAASVTAASRYSAVPGAATAPAADAVIRDRTATGPTASVRLVPRTA